MNWLEFAASLVGSLAWPATVIVLVIVLRKPLGQLLPLLQKLKYRDLELDFRQRTQEIRDEVAAELPVAEYERQAALPPTTAEVARVSPRAAVLEAWMQVESAALQAAGQLGADRLREGRLSYDSIRFLERSDQLDRSVVSLLRDLRGLRNEAAHAPDFALSEGAALEYAEAAGRLTAYLRNVAEHA